MPHLTPAGHAVHTGYARWTRRSVLALGAGTLALLGTRTTAQASPVTVGGLTFEVPEAIHPSPADASLGQGWQWSGVADGATPSRPAAVVLARADLATTESEEVLGLLLASSTTGSTPRLRLEGSRTRDVPGGGEQTRLEVTYAASRGWPYHGTIMVATRSAPPAGLLVVLGDDTLSAGVIDGVLDSARWVS